MKKILILLAIIAPLFMHAAETTDTVTPSTIEWRGYTMQVPAGMLQQPTNYLFKAFLPDGSFGLSMQIDNVRTKKKELKDVCVGMASQLHIDIKEQGAIEAKGLNGWYCTGLLEGQIITAAVVQHSTDLLKIVIMENQTLSPRGPEMLHTLTSK